MEPLSRCCGTLRKKILEGRFHSVVPKKYASLKDSYYIASQKRLKDFPIEIHKYIGNHTLTHNDPS